MLDTSSTSSLDAHHQAATWRTTSRSGRAAKTLLTHREVSSRWPHLVNQFTLRGYRSDASFLGVARSLFELHNETVNIWTHLAGTLLFAALALHAIYTRMLAAPVTVAAPELVVVPQHRRSLSALTPFLETDRGTPKASSWSPHPSSPFASLPLFLHDGSHTASIALCQFGVYSCHAACNKSPWQSTAKHLATEVVGALEEAKTALSGQVSESQDGIWQTLDDLEQRVLVRFMSDTGTTT